tara:strand:+ start:1899 stop:3911 length:2013 start_codon:yes stop_codon:yes gene_type:complete
MSEHDNLQDADGDNLNVTPPKSEITEDVNSLSEVVNEIENKSTEDATIETITVQSKEDNSEEISSEEEEEEEDDDEESLDKGNQKKTDKSDAKIGSEKIDSEESFESLSLEDLVNKFESLLENENSQNVRNNINKIKNSFNAAFAILIAEKKDAFLADGGNVIDFNFTSPLKKRFNDLSKSFRERQQSFQKNRAQQLNQNLEIRLQIIEEIKGLINVEGDINSSYNTFKSLQERWRNTGQIPSTENNNTWNNYRHHVEIFYGFLHLNRDLRDLDYKHNLEQKQKIIQSTEELATETDLNRAFRELQALHKIWKEELGPVAKEFKDELWERFSAATKVINDKRQDYYGQLEETFNDNLVIKNDIIDKIKAISEKTSLVHKEWQANIKEIEALRDAFFKAGKVPSKQNEKTWTAFKDAVRIFNKNKNTYYKTLKKDQSENYRKKLELVEIAEQNKDSLDLETTLALMKDIQNRWKSIGHIPRKDSDKLWKRFRGACNLFFDRYHEQKNNGSEEEIKSFEDKTSLLETLNSFIPSEDKDTNLDSLNQFSSQWKKIGNVTKSKRFIDGKFFKSLDGFYSKIGLDKEALENLKYSLKLETISKDPSLFNNEVIFIRKKIDEIKSEINQLENNLQFFSNVDDDNPLVKEVHKNISKHKEALKVWELKYSKIKKLIN